MFVAIIGVFVLWGVGSVVGDSSQLNAVATVDGAPIAQLEVQRAEYNLLQSYRNAYKDKFTPEMRQALNLRQRALDGLIDRRVLAGQAARLGLGVGDQELRDAIASNPAFQGGGGFSKETYLRALRYMGFTPATFEAGLREDLVVQRLQSVIEDGVLVSAAAARAEVLAREQKLTIDYVKVKASDFTMSVPVTDDDLRKYYDDHQDRYTDQERAKVELIAYRPERFATGLAATADEIAAYYEANRETRFQQSHEVRARHILIKAPEGAGEKTRAEARKKVGAIAAKVKGGADFAALARKESQDEGSAKEGGDLGFFGKGRMVTPFEEAAFSLAPGQVSEVVETPFGFHLIRVEEVREAREKTLDEVRAEIEKALTDEKASAVAQEAAGQDREAWARGKSPAEIATARGLSVEQPPPLQRNDSIPGLGRSFPLTAALWGLEPGGVTQPVDVNGTWVVARLIEKLPSGPKDFATVKDQVETAYRLEKGSELARQAADKLLAAAKEAGSLEKAAKAEKREIQTSDAFARSGAYVPGLGGSQELKDAAFRLSESEPFPGQAFQVAGDSLVIAFKGLTTPSEEEIGKNLAEVRKSMLETRQSHVFQRYLDELKAAARISVDRQKLESMPVA